MCVRARTRPKNCCRPATASRGKGCNSQSGSIFSLCFSPNAEISHSQRNVSPWGRAACVPTMQPSRRGVPSVTKDPRPRNNTGDTFMKTSHRRIALLTGASISALGVSSIFATPAFAAPHDGATVTPLASVNTTTGTLTICEISADADTVPNSPCFYGDYEAGAPVENAATTLVIYQHDAGATVDLKLINNGSAEV